MKFSDLLIFTDIDTSPAASIESISFQLNDSFGCESRVFKFAKYAIPSDKRAVNDI